jgi:hypothetical protein
MLQSLVTEDLAWRDISVVYHSLSMMLSKDTDGVGSVPVGMRLRGTGMRLVDSDSSSACNGGYADAEMTVFILAYCNPSLFLALLHME